MFACTLDNGSVLHVGTDIMIQKDDSNFKLVVATTEFSRHDINPSGSASRYVLKGDDDGCIYLFQKYTRVEMHVNRIEKQTENKYLHN